MARLKLTDFPLHVQERIMRDNPHIYGVGKVEAGQPKQTTEPALERGVKKQKGGSEGLVARVTLVSHVHRVMDDDNAKASLKPLRDSIARDLGIDDGDKRIVFETHQIEVKGQEGVMVKVDIM